MSHYAAVRARTEGKEGQMMDGQRGDRQTSPLLGQNQLTEPKIKRIM